MTNLEYKINDEIVSFMSVWMNNFSHSQSNVISVKDLYNQYKTLNNTKCNKNHFQTTVCETLTTHYGWDCKVGSTNVYPFKGAHKDTRRQFVVIRNLNDQNEQLVYSR